MKRVLSCVFVVSFIALSHPLKADKVSDQMALLDWLIGDWSLVQREESNDGAYFVDKGVRTCEYAVERTLIKCETFLHRVEAEGRHQKPPLTRTSLYFFTFNPEKGQFLQIYFPRGQEPGVNHWNYDAEKQELTFSRPWVHTTLKIESTLSGKLKRISDTEFQGIEEVKALDESYFERSTLTLTKVN